LNKKEFSKLWKESELNTRGSYSPETIKELCPKFEIDFDEKWIYTKNRYREMSDGRPRVDALEFLEAIVDKHNITGDKDKLNTASKMLGEGSRRRLIQEAYRGEI